MDVFAPGDHGSTFGGNPIAAAVGLEALDLLIDQRLIERAAAIGPHLFNRLSAIKSPLIREVRGRGLFAGVELDHDRVLARTVAERCLQAGLLTNSTHRNTVRFAPPLIIDESQIDSAVNGFSQVLEEIAGSNAPV
jgi:ornithine--oxo-acid transaminase